jgi:hypothetical protein
MKKFKILLMSLLLNNQSTSMLKQPTKKVQICENIIGNIAIFTDKPKIEYVYDVSKNLSMIIILNGEYEHINKLIENIQKNYIKHNQSNNMQKEEIKILNLLEDNLISTTIINGKGKQEQLNETMNNLISIDSNIFEYKLEKTIFKCLKEDAGVDEYSSKNIVRILINHFIFSLDINTSSKYVLDLTIFNEKLEKEAKDNIQIFKDDEKYFFSGENKLLNKEPNSVNGEVYAGINVNFEIHVGFERL